MCHYLLCVIVYVAGSRLQNRQRDEWGEIVTIVSCDMRLWAAPEKVHMYLEIRVLMRDEKEGRKKQARSNKRQGKATQHTQGSHLYLYMYFNCWAYVWLSCVQVKAHVLSGRHSGEWVTGLIWGQWTLSRVSRWSPVLPQTWVLQM